METFELFGTSITTQTETDGSSGYWLIMGGTGVIATLIVGMVITAWVLIPAIVGQIFLFTLPKTLIDLLN